MQAASLQKRRLWFAGFLAAFTALLIATNFALYRRAQSHLDAQLGERLRVLAIELGHRLEPAPGDSLSAYSLQPHEYEALVRAREEHGLSNIVVVRPDGRTVADLAGYSQPDSVNPFLALDVAAVDLARAGIASSTRLYRTAQIYMKSAYAPIEDPARGVVGIIGVEAGASFFAQLRELAELILVISVGTVVVVLILGSLFYRRTQALYRAQEQLLRQESLASLGRMVATIAHEIRNPLSIIRSSADRMRRRREVDEEALAFITDEVDGLSRTLTGYLEFAHARPSEFSPIAAARVLQQSLVAVADVAAERSVELVAPLPQGDVVLLGDERRMRQAVLNVLLNAVQAARSRVEVAIAREGGFAHIDIIDDGAGIDPALLKEITRPFFTTRTRGSGLGLAVAQTVVDDHHGSLSIVATEAGGTRVRLAFPLARAAATSREA